jgi:hypothetical protein
MANRMREEDRNRTGKEQIHCQNTMKNIHGKRARNKPHKHYRSKETNTQTHSKRRPGKHWKPRAEHDNAGATLIPKLHEACAINKRTGQKHDRTGAKKQAKRRTGNIRNRGREQTRNRTGYEQRDVQKTDRNIGNRVREQHRKQTTETGQGRSNETVKTHRKQARQRARTGQKYTTRGQNITETEQYVQQMYLMVVFVVVFVDLIVVLLF